MRTTLVHGRIYKTYEPSRHDWTMDVDGALIINEGRILTVGPTREILAQKTDLGIILDMEGRAVVPGFVDCHTHLPFAGWRSDEYLARRRGVSYENIAQKKGGIARSSEQWAASTDDAIMALTKQLAEEAMAWGTTVLEMKTGYGLTVVQELRALTLIDRMRKRLPQRIEATGLFLHAVPPGENKTQWLEAVRTRLLPEALKTGLLSAVDAFVERAAFTPDEVESVLGSGLVNLPIRLHTNQFSHIGGIELAVRLHARTVEHLECLLPAEMDLMAAHGIAAVVMPGAAFYGGAGGHAPARALLERNIRVALATDLNPGSSPVGNLPTVVALAVNLLDMTPEEALAGITREAAYVLGLDETYGAIHPGYAANLVVLDTDTIVDIPYRIGHNPVYQVWIDGRTVTVPKLEKMSL